MTLTIKPAPENSGLTVSRRSMWIDPDFSDIREALETLADCPTGNDDGTESDPLFDNIIVAAREFRAACNPEGE